MDPHSFHASFGSSDNLRRRRRATDEPVEIGRGKSAQERALPGGEDGGEVGGLGARGSVADAIHPAVNADEAAARQPRADLLPRHAGIEELGTGHDAV
jgi:hypothetical protein